VAGAGGIWAGSRRQDVRYSLPGCGAFCWSVGGARANGRNLPPLVSRGAYFCVRGEDVVSRCTRERG
jgi:hypothetical protein